MPYTKLDPDVKVMLSVPCVGRFSQPTTDCTESVEIAFPLPATHDELGRMLWEAGEWVFSLVTPPDASPIVGAVLCPKCMERIYPPELVAQIRRKAR